MTSLLGTLTWLTLIAATYAGVRFCGTKVLLLFPTSIGFLIVGVLGDVLLWDRANGQYQDSDTIIFGLPRVAGSAEAWYGPVSWVFRLLVGIGFLGVAVFALRPKKRNEQ
jgi:nitrogen fixation-related uncharacterized protein